MEQIVIYILALGLILLGFIAAMALASAVMGIVFIGGVWAALALLSALIRFGPPLLISAIRAIALYTVLALREMTGHAARGVSIWDGAPHWQQQAQERVRQEQSIPQIDNWEAACKLLGLPIEGFGKPELSRAYRAAIITAHPDVGGNPALAKALNIARDLIRQQQGWA